MCILSNVYLIRQLNTRLCEFVGAPVPLGARRVQRRVDPIHHLGRRAVVPTREVCRGHDVGDLALGTDGLEKGGHGGHLFLHFFGARFPQPNSPGAKRKLWLWDLTYNSNLMLYKHLKSVMPCAKVVSPCAMPTQTYSKPS